MAFFRNNSVNLLNLHYGIYAIGLNGGAVFFGIYLLQSGLTVPGVLVSLALILLGRFVLRPWVVGRAVRHGLRAMVIAGTLLNAVHYPILAEVHGANLALLAVIVMTAISDTIYWTTYHAYFAALGDDAQRGQQVGVREAMAAVIGIASPLATGWLLVAFGPMAAFGAMAVVSVLAAAPLLWAPDVAVPPEMPGAFRAALPGMLLFAADGWLAAGYVLVWQIALFLAVGHNFLAFGGAVALAALVGAIGSLTLGRHIDAGHGSRAVFLALGTLAVVVVLRAAATGHPALAVGANALGSLAGCLYIPTMMTAVYTLAKRAPCTLRFHVAAEGGWDMGGGAGLLCSALAIRLGLPLSDSILLSLAGVAAAAVMLRRYYGRAPGGYGSAPVDSAALRLPHGATEPGGAIP